MENTNSHFYHLQFAFFVILISSSIILLFFIFKPFLSVLFFAVTLAVIFYPFHRKILKSLSEREMLSSILSVAFILFLILIQAQNSPRFTAGMNARRRGVGGNCSFPSGGEQRALLALRTERFSKMNLPVLLAQGDSLPLIFIGISLFQEATNIYSTLTVGGSASDKFSNSVFDIEESLRNRWPSLLIDISRHLVLSKYLEQGLSWVLENTSLIFSSFVKWVFGLFLMVLALFYFFKDGMKLKKTFISISPLSPKYSEKVLLKIESAINSVVRGRLLVGIIQGISTTLALLVFSVPNPIFLGTIAAVFSVLPIVGPMFIIVPAAIYTYFVSGSLLSSIGLMAWGSISVLLFDEYLSAIIIDKGLKIHPFLILLSILGGLTLFGPIGFILGPISLSLFFSLLDIYPLVVMKG